MSRISETRDWLDTNKVFFETIGAIFITILISATAVFVSIQANNIASSQTELMKVQYQPILDLKIDYLHKGNLSQYVYDETTIINQGAPIRQVKVSDFLILYAQFWLINNEGRFYSINKSLLIYGYYGIHSVINNLQGNLTKLISVDEEGNWNKINRIINELSGLLKNNYNNTNVFFKRYIEISYTTQINERHSEIYYYDDYTSYPLYDNERGLVLSIKNSPASDFFTLNSSKIYSYFIGTTQEIP